MARTTEIGAPAADGMERILALLQNLTSHDLTHYRADLLARRIQRRMALLGIGDPDAYLDRLRENADEPHALLRDLLLGVTRFFRDPAAFDALAEHALPTLVARATPDAPARIWVPACASGEEAYSIAMLAIERFAAARKPVSLQVFATDVDERALETARRGIYPKSIASAMTGERLRRFFVPTDAHHYRVCTELRESIGFAPQNLLADAPFSGLDLISCRNVLIGLDPDVQRKLIGLLHFALADGGFLFLGPSESLGAESELFAPVVKKWRLYRKIGAVRPDWVSIPIAQNADRPARRAASALVRRPPVGFARLLQDLLAEDFAPAAALINRDYQILSLQGPLVNYLEFPPGELTNDLLAMAREGLRQRIRAACRRALRSGADVTDPSARVRRNGGYVPCSITARALAEPKEAEGLVLVVFADRPNPPADAAPAAGENAESLVIRDLESELEATREDLRGAIEELEGANDDFKIAHEELTAANEELQAANEELETSKEELQSLNEELATVNAELRDKVTALDAANGDLANLMVATDIATVFLDADLCIKRFTPATGRLLNLLPSDVGRPFRDIAPRFADDDLLRDAQLALATAARSEKEVRTDERRWYLRRVLPYRTGEDRVGGVVITFVDVTQRTAAEAQARRFASVLRDSSDAVIVSDLDGRITAWNHGARHTYGYSEAEALGMNMRDLIPEAHKRSVAEIAARVARGEEVEPFEAQRVTREGCRLAVWVTLTAIKDESGTPVAIARTERDVTVRQQVEAEIRALNADLERRVADRTSALKALEQEVVRIASLEQQRIGQELHDGTQQELTGLGLLAESLREALAERGSPDAELARRLAEGIAAANRHVRALAKGLVPEPIPADGLVPALAALARDTERTQRLACSFECPSPVEIADDNTAQHLHRIAQEAVTNAVKHARASAIRIRLESGEETLALRVVDDGVGIDDTRKRGAGLGLRIMQHRCNLIGGSLSVRPGVAGGTEVRCVVPTAASARA